MNNMFKRFYPSLGSSYTPNLSMDGRIFNFNNRYNNNRDIANEIIDRKLSAILNTPETYIFNSKLIKDVDKTTSEILVLSFKMQFPNKISNLDLTISTITQLDPVIEPSWIYVKKTNTLEFSLDPVYDLNNIVLFVNILMDDGNTHNYNSFYYGIPTDPTPPFDGPHA